MNPEHPNPKNPRNPKSSKTPPAGATSAGSLSVIAQIAGAAPVLLPGESAEAYEAGRQGAIEELGAKTPLQVYLAEKMFECLWWMRAYETQKRATVLRAMVDVLDPYPHTRDRSVITQAITHGKWRQPDLAKRMQDEHMTPESVLERGMARSEDHLIKLDEQITLRAKTLTSLQASYEALVNRRILQTRLRLQNELMRRDLTAIPVQAVAVVDGEWDGRGQGQEP